MKTIAAAAALSLGICSLPTQSWAQKQPPKRPLVPLPSTTVKDLGKGPKIPDALNPQREKAGERFRLKMWAVPLGFTDRDGYTESSYDDIELYGSLQINGTNWWQLPRSDAYKNRLIQAFQADVIIPITEDTGHNGGRKFEFESEYATANTSRQPLSLKLQLWDRDTRNDDTSKDDMLGNFVHSFDLIKMGPGNYYWVWDSGSGLKSRFNLEIRRIGYIYASQKNPPPIKVIEKEQLPGRLPGPGPVIRNKPILQR